MSMKVSELAQSSYIEPEPDDGMSVILRVFSSDEEKRVYAIWLIVYRHGDQAAGTDHIYAPGDIRIDISTTELPGPKSLEGELERRWRRRGLQGGAPNDGPPPTIKT